mgnify:CR=1 FL=1
MNVINSFDGIPTGLINRLSNGAFALNPEGSASGADGLYSRASF